MEQNTSWEFDSTSAGQEIFNLLWHLKIMTGFTKDPALCSDHLNLVITLTSHFFKISLILPLHWCLCLPNGFSLQQFVHEFCTLSQLHHALSLEHIWNSLPSLTHLEPTFFHRIFSTHLCTQRYSAEMSWGRVSCLKLTWQLRNMKVTGFCLESVSYSIQIETCDSYCVFPLKVLLGVIVKFPSHLIFT